MNLEARHISLFAWLQIDIASLGLEHLLIIRVSVLRSDNIFARPDQIELITSIIISLHLLDDFLVAIYFPYDHFDSEGRLLIIQQLLDVAFNECSPDHEAIRSVL